MDGLVALQDPNGFVHFEPLPLPPCLNTENTGKLAQRNRRVDV